MDFVQYISTPLSTEENDPLITTIKLTRGRLTGGALYFPSGPAGTLHFIAKIGVHQIIPFNTGQNLRLDDAVIPLSLGYDLLEPPYELDCLTWNDSTLYAHTLTLVIHLDPLATNKYDINELMDWYLYGRNRRLQ